MAVPSEEDGGLGTFAELERDDALRRRPAARADRPARRLRPGGRADVQGRRARQGRPRRRAARRRAPRSTGTWRVHAALHAHESTVNANVAHPLMRELELPYPLLVGKVNAGEWSSMVPDRLEFEGRLGVPVGADLARAARCRRVDSALDDGVRAASSPGRAARSRPARPTRTTRGRRRCAAR